MPFNAAGKPAALGAVPACLEVLPGQCRWEQHCFSLTDCGGTLCPRIRSSLQATRLFSGMCTAIFSMVLKAFLK